MFPVPRKLRLTLIYRRILCPFCPNLVRISYLRFSLYTDNRMVFFVSTASQFVIEEKIMAKYSVEPLVAVGLEGFFGSLTIFIFMPVMSLWASRSTFFDLPRGWHQMVDNSTVLWSGVVIAISIAFYNFFGLSVTRHVSANSRSLTDTCRTLSIWLVSLGLGWEKFVWPVSILQVLGFGLLVYVISNELIVHSADL